MSAAYTAAREHRDGALVNVHIKHQKEGKGMKGGGGDLRSVTLNVVRLLAPSAGLVILKTRDRLGFLRPTSLEFTQHSVKKQKHPVRDSSASG